MMPDASRSRWNLSWRHAYRRVPRAWLVAVLVPALLARCSSLTDVDPIDVVQPDQLETPEGAEALRAGALGAFALAYSSQNPFAGTEGTYIGFSGLMADEFTFALASSGGVDARNLPDPSPNIVYDRLQAARINALQAIGTFQRVAPAEGGKIGQLFATVGYIELFFGESFCSGVPLSTIDDGEPVYGQPVPTASLFTQAMAHFDSAGFYASAGGSALELSRVGRGRALLNLGRFDDAAAAVAAVPGEFQSLVEHATTVQPNAVFLAMNQLRISVANTEGSNGLDFVTAADPRVPTQALGLGTDGFTPVFAFTGYGTDAAPVVLASGLEARLIEAEAALQRGDATAWLQILNQLRVANGLGALADPGTQVDREALHFRERAFWLFATGHRHGDLRRLIRQYGRNPEAVFPTGAYKNQGLYGTDVTMTLPVTERINPNYHGCLDRNA
jgi:hypothetical protein